MPDARAPSRMRMAGAQAAIMSDIPTGSGPLADRDIITGGPIDDPTLADRANPRWDDPTSPAPDALTPGRPGAGGDGGAPRAPQPSPDPQGDTLSGPSATGSGAAMGTPQDQAAQELEGQLQVGTDNIREGRGDTVSNPAMAEGGDNG